MFFGLFNRKKDDHFELAIKEFKLQHYVRADELFRISASKGNPEAMNNLAMLHASGLLPYCDIDFAVDNVLSAAKLGHTNCNKMKLFIAKADDCSFGAIAVNMLATQPYRGMPSPLLMMVSCRYYKAILEQYHVVNEFLSEEITHMERANLDLCKSFIQEAKSKLRNDKTIEISEHCEEIQQYFDQIMPSLVQGGCPLNVALFVKCTLIGYIIDKLIAPFPLLGMSAFFNQEH